MKRPDLLICVSDHFRAEALHHLGNAASVTPHLDAMQEEGVSFRNAFCQNPVCVPSRCSFLSGNYPHVQGFRTMHHLQSVKDPNILKELKQQGYHIYFGGKNDVFSKENPLDTYCDYRSDAYTELSCLTKGCDLPAGYHAILNAYTQEDAKRASKCKEASRGAAKDQTYYALYQGVVDSEYPLDIGYQGAEDAQIEDAIRYIEQYQGAQPLCVYLACMLPHPHYAATPDDYAQIQEELIEPCIRLQPEQRSLKPSMMEGLRANQRLYQWSDEALLSFKHTYLAMIHHVDENFGKLMQSLKAANRYEDAAVFMFSDHGDYAGEFELAEINQNTFEDVLTNVPLLIKPPKTLLSKPGIRSALVELIDIPATIAQLCNFSLSYPQFGQSLVPLLAEDLPHRSFVHCEGGRNSQETHCMDAGHDESNLYWARTIEQTKMPQHTKAVMIRSHTIKYVKRLYEQDELYDLQLDPKETNNLIHQEAYQKELQEMKEALCSFMIETCDQVPYHRDER